MGKVLDFLTGAAGSDAGGVARPVSAAIALPRMPSFSPSSSPNLSLVTDWPALGVARESALSIPAAKSCRDLIVGAAVQMKLYRYRATERIAGGALLSQPDPDCSLAATLAGTFEDLLYDGRAYWLVLARDAQATEANPDGFPVRARWIPHADVELELEPDSGSYSRLARLSHPWD